MASLRQIDANRRNGSRGGPKTPEAKQRTRFNALKHQLCAEAVVLPGEDPEVIRQFREDLLEHWQPANAQEQLEFEELVRSAWRLLRARHIETQMWSGYMLGLRDREGAPRPETPLDTHRTMARVLAEDNACNPDKYFRYERAIERSYYRAIRQLQRTQSVEPAHAGTADVTHTAASPDVRR